MNQDKHPAFERFIDSIEASLQVVGELEEMLQQIHDAKSSCLSGSPKECIDGAVGAH